MIGVLVVFFIAHEGHTDNKNVTLLTFRSRTLVGQTDNDHVTSLFSFFIVQEGHTDNKYVT